VTPWRVVVDTNVLVTAAGGNSAASVDCLDACARALREVMTHGHVFIDDGGRIIGEYRHSIDLGGRSDAGEEFLEWVIAHEFNIARVTRVTLTPTSTDQDDFAELPPPPAGVHYDPSDRKFLAVSAAHDEHPPVLQALDSKWWGWRHALAASGVALHFLCPGEIEQKFHEKMD
jgi:hypothetical protein